MITKVTLTYSDGSTHDFLSLDDANQMAGTPELHPDVGVTQNAPEVTPEPAPMPTPEESVPPTE